MVRMSGFELFVILIIIIVLTNDGGFALGSSIPNSFSDELKAALRSNPPKVKIFQLNNLSITRDAKSKYRGHLDIYCYEGERHVDLKLLWTSATLRLVTTSESFMVYRGPHESDVYSQYLEGWWLAKYTLWRSEYLSLPPFNRTCVGVATDVAYTVHFRIKMVDPWLIGYLLVGIVIFFTARKMSRNVMFYYSTGVSVGVLASFLIVVFILSRFMPKKSAAYVILATGWSVSAWFIKHLWDNIQPILENYYLYVAAYFLSAALISWAVCYYKGPPSNPRVHNLLQWFLQGAALVLVYNSSQIPAVSVTFIIALLLWYNMSMPSFIPVRINAIWRGWFPPKVRLLTAEEYIKQGQEETRRALKELREFCHSPECDAWRTVSRLHSPNKFARFVEGEPHISDDEIISYENDPMIDLDYYTDDDEDEMDFRLNSP